MGAGMSQGRRTDSNNLQEVVPKLKGKTAITLNGVSSGADVVIYTVPAGKTFYLCAASLAYQANATGLNALLFTATWNILHFISKITATYYTADAGSQSISFAVPIPFAAGEVFHVQTNAGCNGYASIAGWEENA